MRSFLLAKGEEVAPTNKVFIHEKESLAQYFSRQPEVNLGFCKSC
jgi:hypothetical protein